MRTVQSATQHKRHEDQLAAKGRSEDGRGAKQHSEENDGRRRFTQQTEMQPHAKAPRAEAEHIFMNNNVSHLAPT